MKKPSPFRKFFRYCPLALLLLVIPFSMQAAPPEKEPGPDFVPGDASGTEPPPGYDGHDRFMKPDGPPDGPSDAPFQHQQGRNPEPPLPDDEPPPVAW